MSTNECCTWQAEITDDTLKSMFQADEAYQNGNKMKALAYLKSQVDDRLPLIQEKAVKECGLVKDNLTKMLQHDLIELGDEMQTDAPKTVVHGKVMQIDKKYALPAYRAFCECSKK